MNKQEFQQTIKNMKCKKDCVYMSSFSVYQKGFEKAKELALLHSNSLDEPEKPVVPQFVADWIEWCKKNNATLLGAISPIDELGTAICDDKKVESLDASRWATRNQETFAKAWLYGYEVEKEKRYTAKLKLTNEYLCYESQFKDLLHYKVPDSSAKEVKSYHFTEDDLVKYHIWGNNAYKVNEVI